MKQGDRIRLIEMGEDLDPIPPGSEGTVVGVSDLGAWKQIDVDWDNGRKLFLSVPPDQAVVIEPAVTR